MKAPSAQPSEQNLVALYMQTTGATETSARNVFMFLDLPEPQPADQARINPVRVEPDLSQPADDK